MKNSVISKNIVVLISLVFVCSGVASGVNLHLLKNTNSDNKNKNSILYVGGSGPGN